MEKLAEFGDLRATDRWKGLAAILSDILSILVAILSLLCVHIAAAAGAARLRYVNIETPDLGSP